LNERVIDDSDVTKAARRLAGLVRRTPMVDVAAGVTPLWLKCEFMQHTGSFKARGALNRVLSAREDGELDPGVGIVVASGGNAGLANAYAAAHVGVPATVFVPESAPRVKVDRIRRYGADVRRVGTEYAHAYDAAVRHAEDVGAVFCHAYDQPAIAAGAGTLALEVLEDQPTVDVVVVAVGGGGLLAGVLAGLDGRARVVAVEPRSIPTLNTALAQRRPVDVAVSGVAADSLGARRIGDICWDVVDRNPVTSVLVSDDDIVAARTALWNDFRIAAEHGGATALAALRSQRYVPEPGERVAVVVCGANTDLATLP